MFQQHILELMGAASRGGSRVDFITSRGSNETTFAELWSLSSRAASGLRQMHPPECVAGLLTPSAEMVSCLVGSLRNGNDFVSLPLPGRGQDPSTYLQQLQTIVSLSSANAIVVEAAYAALLRSLPGALPCPLLVAEELVESGATDGPSVERRPGDLIQFSSGTTGTPKGIRLSGYAIAASVQAMQDALLVDEEPETFCSWVPLSHDMGLIGGLLGSWAGSTRTRSGYRYICISPELFLARPLLWMETCAAAKATITAAPTFGYHLVSRRLGRCGTLDLSSLRACLIGAERVGADTLEAFTAATRSHGLREAALCPAYGLAEATLAVSIHTPGQPWITKTISVDGHQSRYVSCGRVLPCVTVDAPAARAGVGPIRLRGPALCSGYLPERPVSASGWLDTGDLGVVADGELVVTGRADDLLCVAGRNLFAWELECAVAIAVPQVRPGGCAVVANGAGSYVVLFEGQALDHENINSLLAKVRMRLAAVAGVGPSGVGCLRRGTLPKTPSGKLRRNGIAAELDYYVASCVSYRAF